MTSAAPTSTVPHVAPSALRRTTAPTPVLVVGAGPAGLALGCLLLAAGLHCTIVEKRSRAHVQARPRAGLWEHRSVEMLRRHGLAAGLLTHGSPHDACEIRVDGDPHLIKFGALTGTTQRVRPQQDLVADLIVEFLSRGGRLHFDASDVVLHLSDHEAVVRFRASDGSDQHLSAAFVAGADGAHGISRNAIPAGATRTLTHEQPFGWLAVLAQTPPSAPHIIYSVHEAGFAGHMLRSPFTEVDRPIEAGAPDAVTRFYLQCPIDDTVGSWPAPRIWDELHVRMSTTGDLSWKLRTGPIIDTSIVRMRSSITAPMQFGRLFLVGDAAHTITPVGAKGANLALHDAAVLANALTAWDATGDEAGLRAYSSTCLQRVRECQVLSHRLTRLLHEPVPGPAALFERWLARADLAHLLGDDNELTAFARAYVGVDA